MHLSTNKKRDEVAVTIRSLLITYQHGVTISMLEKDYEEVECEQIPFKEFNCPTLLVFLKQLHNYVRIERIDGRLLLFPVENEKVKHIAELVKYQNSKKPNRRRFQRPYQGFCANKAQVSINNTLLSELISCVSLCPHGLPINYVMQYLNQYIHPLQITRQELEHQLKALSHLIAIYGDNLYPINQVPVFPQPYLNYYAYTPSWKLNNNNYFHTSTFRPNIVQQQTPINEPPKESNTPLNKVPLIVKGIDNVYKPNEKLKPSPVEVTQNHQMKNNSHIPFQSNETLKIVCDDKQNCKANFKEPCLQEDETVSEKSNVKTNHENPKDENFIEPDRNITILTQIKLSKLIQKFPNGIWFSELSEIYLKEYNTPLTFSKTEFSSLLNFVSSLTKIFHCVRPLNQKDYKLFNAKNCLPHLNKDKTPNSHDYSQDHLDFNDFKSSLLKEVLGIEEAVKYTSVTEYQKSNVSYEEITIFNVISPSFFWIHLCKNSTIFKQFVNELKNFYENNSYKYKVPLALLQRGLNVVCFFRDRWCRGLIKEVCGDSRITISLYDYGVDNQCFPNEIYFLHKSFANFPVQAIPCSLYNVKPYQSSMWSQDVIWKFVSKTSFPLIATVEKINLEENQLFVDLTDTRTDEDFHINDWLCNEKFGEPGQYTLKHENFPFSHYKECLKQKGFDSLSLHYVLSEGDEATTNLTDVEKSSCKSENKNSEQYPHRLKNLLASYPKSNVSEDNLPPLKKITTVSVDKCIAENSKPPSFSRLLALQKMNNLHITNSSETNGKEGYNDDSKPSTSSDIDSKSITDHSSSTSSLKESPRQAEEEMPYFGTFGSECGGRGRMDPINWQEALKSKNCTDEKQQRSNNIEENVSKQQEEESKDIPPFIKRLLKLQSKQKKT